MLNIVKSLLVLLLILLVVVYNVLLIIKFIFKYKQHELKKSFVIKFTCFFIASLLFVFAFGDYVYPFERELHPVCIEEITLPAKHEFDYPGQKYWHGAYEKYGLYADSFNFDSSEKVDHVYGFEWPDMDFKHYSYVITYGQKIEKLTYNVWDTIDHPIRTGAKIGHMTLDEEFYPNKIFVYQILKMRLDHDLNDL